MREVFAWLNDTSLGVAVRESTYLFPLFNAIHVFSLCLLMGTVSVLDFRLLGLALRRRRG